jgi:hypothetical protein
LPVRDAVRGAKAVLLFNSFRRIAAQAHGPEIDFRQFALAPSIPIRCECRVTKSSGCATTWHARDAALGIKDDVFSPAQDLPTETFGHDDKCRSKRSTSPQQSVGSETSERLHSISTIISTSTALLEGRAASPTAERACLPAASPNTSTIKSENPSITWG